MIFSHTMAERGSWRGWFRDGQVMEIAWWQASFGASVTYHAGDSAAKRFLWIGLGFIQFFIPIGLVKGHWEFGDEPQWGFDLSREFGIVLHWGQRRKHWEWPFHTILLNWSYESADASRWINTKDNTFVPGKEWDRRHGAKIKTYPYTYTLRSGEVQEREATIIKERWTRGRHILSRLGWPSRIDYCIDISFNGEVGEEAGSWKGGVVGCGQTMLPGETPLDTLRRMERERKF